MRSPPASSLRCGDSLGGGEGVTSETIDDKQTTIKSRQRVAFDKGVSILHPYQHPPKRHNLPLGLGGGGGRIRSVVERKGRGCNYHEVDDDGDDSGKGVKQGNKH
jgi:hypothetical protein